MCILYPEELQRNYIIIRKIAYFLFYSKLTIAQNTLKPVNSIQLQIHTNTYM